MAMVEQRKWLRKNKFEMLKKYLLGSHPLSGMIRGIQGGRTRLWKILFDFTTPKADNSVALAVFEGWNKMHSLDANLFYNDNNLLISHYLDALSAEKISDRMLALMKADLMAFARWMNAQTQKSKRIQKFWDKNQYLLDEFYDQTHDCTQEEQLQHVHGHLIILMYKINNWMGKLVAGTAGSDDNDWDEMLIKALKMEPVKIDNDAEMVEFYATWMGSLHFETMLKMFELEDKFGEQLEKVLMYFNHGIALAKWIGLQSALVIIEKCEVHYGELLTTVKGLLEVKRKMDIEKKQVKTQKKKEKRRNKNKLLRESKILEEGQSSGTKMEENKWKKENMIDTEQEKNKGILAKMEQNNENQSQKVMTRLESKDDEEKGKQSNQKIVAKLEQVGDDKQREENRSHKVMANLEQKDGGQDCEQGGQKAMVKFEKKNNGKRKQKIVANSDHQKDGLQNNEHLSQNVMDELNQKHINQEQEIAENMPKLREKEENQGPKVGAKLEKKDEKVPMTMALSSKIIGLGQHINNNDNSTKKIGGPEEENHVNHENECTKIKREDNKSHKEIKSNEKAKKIHENKNHEDMDFRNNSHNNKEKINIANNKANKTNEKITHGNSGPGNKSNMTKRRINQEENGQNSQENINHENIDHDDDHTTNDGFSSKEDATLEIAMEMLQKAQCVEKHEESIEIDNIPNRSYDNIVHSTTQELLKEVIGKMNMTDGQEQQNTDLTNRQITPNRSNNRGIEAITDDNILNMNFDDIYTWNAITYDLQELISHMQKEESIEIHDKDHVKNIATNKLNEKHDIEIDEFAGLKLGDFWDDNLLAMKYGEFIGVILADETETVNGRPRLIDFPELGNENTEKSPQNDRKMSLIRVLDIGALANEICHRIEAMTVLHYAMGERMPERAKIEKEWKQMRQSEVGEENLEKELYLLLKKIVMVMDGSSHHNGVETPKNIMEEAELQNVVQQLHRRKFAKAIYESKGILWHNLIKIRQKTILAEILRMNGENDQMIEQFEHFVSNSYPKAIEQRNLDEHLLNQYQNCPNLNRFVDNKTNLGRKRKLLSLKLFEGWQELKLTENEKIISEKMEKINSIIDNRNVEAKKVHTQRVIKELETIIKNWYDPVQFHVGALHHLDYEKVELLCIFPEEFDLDNQIINIRHNCDQQDCPDNSLYCALCKNQNVELFYFRVPSEKYALPFLRFRLMEKQVDLHSISLPAELKSLHTGQFNLHKIELLSEKFAESIYSAIDKDDFDEHMVSIDLWQRKQKRKELENERLKPGKSENAHYIVEELEKQINFIEKLSKIQEKALHQRKRIKKWIAMEYVLSDFAIYFKILDYLSVNQKDSNFNNNNNVLLEKFRTVLRYLELWAKSNHIYSTPLMGYLDTKILAIMLTKVVLLYPDSSVPFLIEKFFLVFTTWKWPIPVALSDYNPRNNDDDRPEELLVWSPSREWFIKRQFVVDNVKDKHYWKEMIREIRAELGMVVIGPVFPQQNMATNVNLQSAKVIQTELRNAFLQLRNIDNVQTNMIELITPMRFTDKYKHFIVAICSGPQLQIENFCNFVGERLRHDLLDFVDNPLANWVQFCHIYPTFITIDSECQQTSCPIYKRAWLVGIKTTQNALDDTVKIELKSKLTQMDIKIKDHYQKGSFCKVELNSEFVENKEGLDEMYQKI